MLQTIPWKIRKHWIRKYITIVSENEQFTHILFSGNPTNKQERLFYMICMKFLKKIKRFQQKFFVLTFRLFFELNEFFETNENALIKNEFYTFIKTIQTFFQGFITATKPSVELRK